MKPERRKQYPQNWEQLARECKVQAKWVCQQCGVAQRTERISRRTGVVYAVFLHAAHRDHDISNPSPILLCLCPTCHGCYDYCYRKREQRIALERRKHQMLLLAR